MCGITGIEFLNIDHIEGRAKYRHDRSFKGGKLYRFLKNQNCPDGFQVLCWNCNVKKHLDVVMQKPSGSNATQEARRITRLIKSEVFSAVSKGKLECACCKENSGINLLTVDHIEGRKSFGHSRDLNGREYLRFD